MSNIGAEAAVALIIASLPNKEFPQASQRLYVRLLADIDPELLQAATLAVITEGSYFGFPSVADIRKRAQELRAEAAGELTPGEAFEQLMSEVRRVGRYGSPELNERTREALRQIGGWQALCSSEHLPSERARFTEAYTRLATVENRRAIALPEVKRLVEKLTTAGLLEGGQTNGDS